MKKHVAKFWGVTAGLLLIAAVPASAQDSVGVIERALEEFRWESVEAEGVRVLFKAGSFAERHRHMLLRSAQVAVSEVMEFLGEAEYDRELRLIYVDSREEMNELVGRPITGFAVWTENGVFLVVMAYDEYTTDVPEQRAMKPRVYWDRRARGLGGSPVSCAEENVLCFPGDPYSTENILIHEFAHTVHGMGLPRKPLSAADAEEESEDGCE